MKIKQPNKTGEFPVNHYSHSSMIRFSTNPILFKIHDINGDRFDTSMGISGVIGQAFHKAMEVYYGGNDDMPVGNEQEAIEFGLKVGAAYLNDYNDGFIEFNKSVPNKQKAMEMFAFAFREYVASRPYGGDEVLVSCEEKLEEYVNVEWRGHKLNLPVKLKGYTDKIVRQNGKLKIKDYKTTRSFSDPEKIDGSKILQAVQYYLLVYARYGEEPESITFEEVKITKNKEGGDQVKEYEIVYAENELYFDFYFRFYEDITRALNGEMVYVPNIHSFFDNEVALISYIHRLDVSEEQAKLMKKHKVDNITDLLKKKIQSAGNMRKLLKTVEEKFVSAKNLNYKKMTNEEKIQTKMLEYGMMLQFDSKIEGATVDLYRYTPSIGLKMSRLKAFVDDIEQVLGVSGIRVLAPIQGSSLVGYEVPRSVRSFPALPASKKFELAIGQTIEGKTRYFDIRQAPHVLVAGSTGSGKSVFLHSLIRQLLKLPKAELHLFDPKQVELLQYEESAVEYKHSHEGIRQSLEALVEVMETRYDKMKKAKARNISELNGTLKFVVIDEYADLAMREQTGNLVKLLAQKGRAAGIHLIVATQRASTKVIDGDIKVNFTTKAVFRMAKEVDSRVMLDEAGAEKLLGKGDMLFATEAGVERLQGFSAL
jgi:hypothetical protein